MHTTNCTYFRCFMYKKEKTTIHKNIIYIHYCLYFFSQIYPTKLQLNKANASDTEAPFLVLDLSITNGIVSIKIYDKRDDFNF